MNRKGYVLLWRGSGLIGWLIKWQTRSQYSHAALMYPDGETILEAKEFRGVQRRKLTDKDRKLVDVFEVIGMSDTAWTDAFLLGEKHLGAKYDWWSVLKFVSRRPAKVNKRWFCSELVCHCIKTAFGPLLERMPCHETNPGHLSLSPLLRRVQ